MIVLTVVLMCGVTLTIAGTFLALAAMFFRMRHPDTDDPAVGFSERTISSMRSRSRSSSHSHSHGYGSPAA